MLLDALLSKYNSLLFLHDVNIPIVIYRLDESFIYSLDNGRLL
jgi:hypothetical protein